MSLSAGYQQKLEAFVRANGYLQAPQVVILLREIGRLRSVRDAFNARLELLRVHLGDEQFFRVVYPEDSALWADVD